LTTVSVVAGLAEASVLVLVANVASAMVLRDHHVSSGLGSLGLHLSIGSALLLALALSVVRLALQVVIAWLPSRISADVQAGLRTDLFDAYTRASWTVQAEDAEGHLQELMTDQVNQATSAVLFFANALYAAAMSLALLISAFALDAVVAVIVLACSVLLFGLLRPIDRVGRAAARDQSQTNMEHAGGVSEAVRLSEEMHVFGSAAALRHHVGEVIAAARHATFRATLASRVVYNVYQSLAIVLILGGLAGLYLIRAGDLAALGAVVLMLVRVSAYGQQFQAANHGLIQAMPYIDRIDNAIARYRASAPDDEGERLTTIRSLAFDHVDFAYTGDRTVLHDVSFQVTAGEAVGIIGPTGAGKSTLSQLLLRLRVPSRGAYLVNGAPASSFARADWQRRVAYVPQEPRVLRGSVADNIRFFRDIDQATVEEAARQAHIHDEIVAMSAGYETVIGQRADAVSGGQRQRICLARALAGRPDVLLLDEPTSALDLASEAAVRASLADLHGQVTLFIIAHRLPLIDICDRVVVLDRGRLKAFAPAQDLDRQDAFYRRIVALADRPSVAPESSTKPHTADVPAESHGRPKTA
jgi:ABC-type multidrug transport system fused ATPase/permease subunit